MAFPLLHPGEARIKDDREAEAAPIPACFIKSLRFVFFMGISFLCLFI
jgi:hypothetical protein